MIAQILFTLVLLAVVLVAFAQLARLPLIGGAVICVALFGIWLVWMPEEATRIAHFVGVGRGTDLVMYVWVLISFSVWLVLYLVLRDQLQLITALARDIALKQSSRSLPGALTSEVQEHRIKNAQPFEPMQTDDG